jgi:1-acyl-sn-glycerol-3-phosphate acyltransferase
MVNPGKIKIFDKEPKYNGDDLTQDSIPVAELRNSQQTFKLSRSVRTYWIIFYPEKTALNLTVTFHKDGTQAASDAKVKVTQSIIGNVAESPAVLKATDSQKARFTVENYGNAKAGPFVVLD